MRLHANAKLGVKGRELLIDRVASEEQSSVAVEPEMCTSPMPGSNPTITGIALLLARRGTDCECAAGRSCRRGRKRASASPHRPHRRRRLADTLSPSRSRAALDSPADKCARKPSRLVPPFPAARYPWCDAGARLQDRRPWCRTRRRRTETAGAREGLVAVDRVEHEERTQRAIDPRDLSRPEAPCYLRHPGRADRQLPTRPQTRGLGVRRRPGYDADRAARTR